MSENGEPRWELLPHDAAGFFELADSFDRKDLKKRYTDLIRRYKPEKHPSEFQRIREAYEALDAMLRYGQQERPDQPTLGHPWSTGKSTTKPVEAPGSRGDASPGHRQPVRDEPAPVLALTQRLEREEPGQLYEELKGRESKSPFDYYALAVLADVVMPDERPGFLGWILAGLKAFPHEQALSALLYELLRQNDFGDASGEVLVAVSQAFPSDRFYYFTETVWDRLLKGDLVEQFAPLLKQCETNLRDHRIGAKVTFYVRILRTALWRASDEWIERTLAFLKENQDQISGELEYEMEFNLQLNRYRQSADRFVDGSPEREKIDRCIREFCTLDVQQAAERVVRTQLELAADSQMLLKAIPYDRADFSEAYRTLRWIALEANARLGIEWPQPDYDKLWENTVQFMRQVDAMDDPSAWQAVGLLKAAVEFAALVVISALVVGVVTTVVGLVVNDRRTASTIQLTGVVCGVVGSIALCLYLRGKTTNRWFNRRREKIALRKYQKHWRGQTLRFVQNTQYPLEDIHAAIAAAVDRNPNVFAASTWLPGLVPSDFGLAFYALAHLYVR